MVGLTDGLVIAAANLASAQLKFPYVVDPGNYPDLTVSMNAPASTNAYTFTLVTIKVDNQAPTNFPGITGTSSAQVNADLTGLVPQFVQSASGNLQCAFGAGFGGAVDNEWNRVSCNGNVAYGATETIYVWVLPSPTFYCGRPTYTDVGVSSSSRERSTANNRVIARTDPNGCINWSGARFRRHPLSLRGWRH